VRLGEPYLTIAQRIRAALLTSCARLDITGYDPLTIRPTFYALPRHPIAPEMGYSDRYRPGDLR
jgi:hypothetical protein